MTTTHNWSQIKTLFADSLERPTSQRASFLLARSSDPQLIYQVHRLLQLEQKAGRFLSQPLTLVHPPAPRPALAAGVVVANRYRIERLIGTGGMCGGVYEAFDLEHQVPLALKVMADTREFLVSRTITHANVCRVFDCGRDGDMRFITMELLDGETLENRLARKGRLTPAAIAALAFQLCAGITAAHRAAVLHRDLKPANIFLTNSGRVVVTDFGLARNLNQSTSASIHLTGTLPYMAPEVLAGRAASIQSDIYSLGVILHEAATGKLPCDHVTLTGSNKEIIQNCLRMNPGSRPQSAENVAHAFEIKYSWIRDTVRFWCQKNYINSSTVVAPATPPRGRTSAPDFIALSGLPW